MCEVGVKCINISFDMLKVDCFWKIIWIGDLNKVLKGIDVVGVVGFWCIKLNVVMMCGINDDEFVDLV